MTKSAHGKTIIRRSPAAARQEPVASPYLDPTEAIDPPSPAHERALQRHVERGELISIADQIAESPMWERNWKIPRAEEHFPNDPAMRVVDKCYRMARGGLLLIDEPTNQLDEVRARGRHEVCLSMGLRHVILLPTMDSIDAVTALEEVDKRIKEMRR